MRLTSYNAILTQVYSLLNLVAADAVTGDQTKINAFIQRRTREAFQKHWWDETMRIEERWFRAFYASGTAYAAPTSSSASEVFHPGSRGYYQALKATTGNAPATLSGTTWSTNTSYWAAVDFGYAGNDWTDATVYAVGDTVRSVDDGLYYRCHTAHTSSSSLDATKFGILTEWLPYISLDQASKTAIGLVRGLYLDHPGRTSEARRVKWMLGPNGIHLLDNRVTSVFVWFQIKPPVLSGSTYSAGTAYAVGDYVYYSSATTGYEGDYWKCATATTAGQNPETHASKWTRQEIPEGLRDAIAHAVYSDFLRPAGNDSAIPIEETAGGSWLATELHKAVAMQRQAGKWTQS